MISQMRFLPRVLWAILVTGAIVVGAGLSGALFEPVAENGDGLAGERRGSVFAAFPDGLDVRAGAEVRGAGLGSGGW